MASDNEGEGKITSGYNFHGNINLSSSDKQGHEEEPLDELTCNHCGFMTFKRSSLINHMKSEHATEWDLHFRRPSVVLKGPRKVYPCPMCDYRPSSRVILKHHVRRAHGTRDYKIAPVVCNESVLKSSTNGWFLSSVFVENGKFSEWMNNSEKQPP